MPYKDLVRYRARIDHIQGDQIQNITNNLRLFLTFIFNTNFGYNIHKKLRLKLIGMLNCGYLALQ